jgi:hypothetical protein
MATINPNPVRLLSPKPYNRLQLPVATELSLPAPNGITRSFLSAMLLRRSAEQFSIISSSALSTWLHFSGSIQSLNAIDPNRQKRYVASFGGLHPTQILLGNPDHSWAVYLPERHMLGRLHVQSSAAQALRESAERHHSAPNATLVLLISDEGLVSAYYDNARELIVRDAGVLLGHGSLVAASLGLAFRILGSCGSPWAEEMIVAAPFKLKAVGMAWLGALGNEH